ncbi:hypothetical protein [Pedobacter sp. GR22-6]|uniref:hypothetical protein n=1 Tax=Pedobacter sp. GR22-6 TaxID=3127957 RepID=UPI00307E7840
MKNKKTPQPGEEDYPLNQPQNLNIPKFNSSGKKDLTDDLPPVENMNDLQIEKNADHESYDDRPLTDLGNERSDNEEEKERIIRR